MAHQNLTRHFVSAFALATLAACGGNAAPPNAPAPATVSHAEPADGELPLDAKSWGDLHATKVGLTLRLPDAKNWVVAKSSKPVFVVEHRRSKTAIVATTFFADELVNRASCEDKARAAGLVPRAMAGAQTIEDEAIVGPDDFDTRVWVSIRRGEKGTLVGDVLAFGAHVRKCLFFHAASIVPSEQQADALSERLAALRLHAVGDLKVDPIEAVPRAPEH